MASILQDVTWLMGDDGHAVASATATAATTPAGLAAGTAAAAAVPWSGPVRLTSDYFGLLLDAAHCLIEGGHAYVDFSTPDELRRLRGTLTEPGTASPCRLLSRPACETRRLFAAMVAGDYAEGAAPVLRARIDMASPNLNLRDPVLFRVKGGGAPGAAPTVFPM